MAFSASALRGGGAGCGSARVRSAALDRAASALALEEVADERMIGRRDFAHGADRDELLVGQHRDAVAKARPACRDRA